MGSGKEVFYGVTKGAIAIFDDILSVEDSQATDFIEKNKKEWFANHLSASLSLIEIDKPHPSPVFFMKATIFEVQGSPSI